MHVRRQETIEEALGDVDQVMQRDVVTVASDEPLAAAARRLETAGISGAPVMEGGRVVGMITLSNVFRVAGVSDPQLSTSGPWHRWERTVAALDLNVRDAMTRTVVAVRPTTPIAAVARLMREQGVNRVPVLDQAGTLVGIVARDDVVRAVANCILTVGRRRHPAGASMSPD